MSEQHKLFISQEILDVWMTEGIAEVEGETMELSRLGQRFDLRSAVHFLSSLEGGDAAELIGKVKDQAQLAQMGAEHVSDSVLLGETAYLVAEGFVADPIFEGRAAPVGSTGDETLDVIGRFFLGR